MELKVVCDCGQKYAFDVEPVNNRMPVAVNCPACGADGTTSANRLITQSAVPPEPPSRVIPAPLAAPPRPLATPVQPAPPSPVKKPVAKTKTTSKEFSMGRGIFGALLGAGLGTVLLLGFAMCFHFLFPFSGVLVGVLAGYGARLLFKGTDSTLGFLTTAIALVFYGGLLVLLLGPGAIGSIISIVICGVSAWRIASG